MVALSALTRSVVGHVAGLYHHSKALEAACGLCRVHVHISGASTSLISRWLALYETSFAPLLEPGQVQGIVYGYVHGRQNVSFAGAHLSGKQRTGPRAHRAAQPASAPRSSEVSTPKSNEDSQLSLSGVAVPLTAAPATISAGDQPKSARAPAPGHAAPSIPSTVDLVKDMTPVTDASASNQHSNGVSPI